jgi:hypothetical protein
MEAEPFVELDSRVDFCNGEAHGMVGTLGVNDQTIHYLSADAPPLNRNVHKQLRDKKLLALFLDL